MLSQFNISYLFTLMKAFLLLYSFLYCRFRICIYFGPDLQHYYGLNGYLFILIKRDVRGKTTGRSPKVKGERKGGGAIYTHERGLYEIVSL